MIAPGFFLAILGLIRIGSTWIWIWILTQNKYPESDYPISNAVSLALSGSF
jgi:hypothetical protein